MRPPTPDQLKQQCRDAMDRGDWFAAEQIGARLDATTRHDPVPLLSAALWYAQQGIPVFPLVPGGKHPFPGTHGLTDATLEAGQILRWWNRTPDANIGLATGHRCDVIDIDGPDGVTSWSQLVADDALPPILGRVSTPRPAGTHLYVPTAGLGNKAGIYPGIDYRGRGGYVVAPPSLTRDGVLNIKHAGPYTWRTPLQLPPAEQANTA